jgi:hypothetical protein
MDDTKKPMIVTDFLGSGSRFMADVPGMSGGFSSSGRNEWPLLKHVF